MCKMARNEAGRCPFRTRLRDTKHCIYNGKRHSAKKRKCSEQATQEQSIEG